MFEYIRGKLAAAIPTKVVIDVGGVGYSIRIALNTYTRLPQIGQELLFYVAHVVREDAHLLFGFLTLQERSLFDEFTAISGIGPKTAMALLGHLEITDLSVAITTGNTALLSKVPGIGKKIAQRLIVEMQGKLEKELPLSLGDCKGPVADAISALINLGYHPSAAQKAVQRAAGDEKEPELGKLISKALQRI